jgi:hypothetical protein
MPKAHYVTQLHHLGDMIEWHRLNVEEWQGMACHSFVSPAPFVHNHTRRCAPPSPLKGEGVKHRGHNEFIVSPMPVSPMPLPAARYSAGCFNHASGITRPRDAAISSPVSGFFYERGSARPRLGGYTPRLRSRARFLPRFQLQQQRARAVIIQVFIVMVFGRTRHL